MSQRKVVYFPISYYGGPAGRYMAERHVKRLDGDFRCVTLRQFERVMGPLDDDDPLRRIKEQTQYLVVRRSVVDPSRFRIHVVNSRDTVKHAALSVGFVVGGLLSWLTWL